MNCLFIDLASNEAHLACVTDDAVIASRSIHARIPDNELIPFIEELLNKAGWTYEDLTHLACIIGPGGFTSLKVAVTCINVLSDQLDIPVVGIHLADLYAARNTGYRLPVTGHDIYWLHSTTKDQLFICGGEWKEPTLISIDDIPDGNWAGELIEGHRSKISTDPIPLAQIEDILPSFLTGQKFSKDSLTPWYGRGW